jgi:hypothetical protein
MLAWFANSKSVREKLVAVGLVELDVSVQKLAIPTLEQFPDECIKRHGKTRKPATVSVWKPVVATLKELMPAGIRVDEITVGHAKVYEKLKAKGIATSTIHKRIEYPRQFMHDAVDWKFIEMRIRSARVGRSVSMSK